VPAPAKVADCSSHERAFGADPFATAAYDQWAECASKAGRHADVSKRMRVALRDNPDWSRGWLHLGRACRALGDATQAKAALTKACAAGVTEACGN
jgi:cytochrome c-type biogenesis protein CcmH/NrfG